MKSREDIQLEYLLGTIIGFAFAIPAGLILVYFCGPWGILYAIISWWLTQRSTKKKYLEESKDRDEIDAVILQNQKDKEKKDKEEKEDEYQYQKKLDDDHRRQLQLEYERFKNRKMIDL